VPTPDERLADLRQRALAANIEPADEPEDLARLSLRSLVRDTGGVVQPDNPEVDIRLHGPGVPGHTIPVRDAAAILTSLQETLASIGQALTHQPTAQGPIHSQVLKATELRMSPTVGLGSIVFHLNGPAEEVSGDEAVALTGTDTLVDAAVRELFAIVEHSEAGELGTGTLADELRRFGPRAAKHLSDLVDRVVKDEIDVDFTWRSPAGRRRRASLHRRSALVIHEAIKRNEVETTIVELTGTLVTVSKVTKAELQTDEYGRIRLSVDDDRAAMLGPFYNQRVLVLAEQTTKWSMNTGQETRTFRLLDIRMADEPVSG
jgi:hypothetical protein